MFAKLKQKIEKETGLSDLNSDKFGSTSDLTAGASRKQRVSASPLPDEISPTIHQSAHSTSEGLRRGPRLTKRLSSASSEPENWNKSRADERYSACDTTGGETSAEPHDLMMGTSATSKEELLEMLVRRTKQVKSLDTKLADLGILLKEKNQMIEKLETALEKQQDVLCQRVQELNEQYHSGRAKMSENIAAAVRQKELEMKQKIESLDKELMRATNELRQLKTEGGGTGDTISSLDSQPVVADEMKKKMEELENKNKLLREDVEKLRAGNKSLEKQLQASKDAFAQMALESSQEDWLEKQIENETNLSALDSQLQKLKAELSQRDNEKSSLLRQLSDKVSELSETKKSLTRLEEQQTAAVAAEQQLQLSLTAAQQLCSQQQAEKSAADSKEAELIRQCDSYKAELCETKQKFEERLTNQDQAIQELNDLFEMKQTEASQLEDKVKSLESEREVAAVDAGRVGQLTGDVEKMENQLLEKNRIIKKLEQRLNDMKKLVQRELKGANPLGGEPQQHSATSGAMGGLEVSNPQPSDTNGLRPNLSASSLHAAANAVAASVGNGSGSGTNGSISGIRPSESYPNLSTASAALQPQNFSHGNTVATLPVSYSVTELHYNNVSYTNSATAHDDDDVAMLGIEQQTYRSAGESTAVHYPAQRLVHNMRQSGAVVLSKNSSSAGSGNTAVSARTTARSLTAEEIAELMGGGMGPLSGRGGDYELSRDLNLKYLRHVILKFLLSRESEAIHLLRALSTLLEFTEEEQKLLKDTLQWKMSWFGSRPQVPDRGQTAKIIPPTAFS